MCVNSGLDLQIHVVMHLYCSRWCCRVNRQISTVVSDTCPDLKVEVLAVSLGREEYQLLFFLFLPSCCYSLLRANQGQEWWRPHFMGVEYPVTGGHPIILYRGSQLSKSQTNSSLPGRIVLYINSSMSLKHPIFLCQGVFPNPAEPHELDCECSLLLNLNSCRYFRPQLFRRELQGTKE